MTVTVMMIDNAGSRKGGPSGMGVSKPNFAHAQLRSKSRVRLRAGLSLMVWQVQLAVTLNQ